MDILSDFLVKKGKGYYCKYGDFYIDPLYPVQIALVSHAHGDHASPGHKKVYATAFTNRFMQYRFPKYNTQFMDQGFNESILINGVEITFVPAGHMLGSAQILLKYKGVRYLYTGDYKLQLDTTCEPLEFIETDVLITETTFADNDVIHPDPSLEIQKLKDIDTNIMLGCYSLGKAQRLTAMLNEYCPDKIVLTHHKIAPIHHLYEELGGIKLSYKIYGRRDMKDKPYNKVYLVPPLTFNSYYRATNVTRVFASGWERLQRNNDIALYISDHVDWNDLLFFISQVKPREIWTIHGDGSSLKEHYRGVMDVRDIYMESQ